jgi:hypothetical protein
MPISQMVVMNENIKTAGDDTRIEHVPEKQIDLEELGETSGYLVDLELINTVPSAFGQLKTAADGHTILIPQPSDDPDDPLNWSRFRKHAILFTIAATAFLPDYGSATGAVTLLPQAHIWGMTEDHVNHSQVGMFMPSLGLSGAVKSVLTKARECIHAWRRRLVCCRPIRLFRALADPVLVHVYGVVDSGLVCWRCHFRVIHGCTNPQRFLFDSRTRWWIDVHQGHVLLPRACPEDQHMGGIHHPVALLRPSHSRLHHLDTKVAVGIWSVHHRDRLVLDRNPHIR